MMRNEVRASITNYLDFTVSNENSDKLVKPHVRSDIDTKGEFRYPLFK